MINKKHFNKLIEKWPAKVLSLAAAIIISAFYRINTLESRSFSAPLNIETENTLPSADALIPASSYPQTVRINLRGENANLFSILEEDIEAYVNLSKYKEEGSYRIPIQIRKKGGAVGIEPLEIKADPIEIHIILEKKISRSVNVFPVFQGTPARGYELTSQSITPAAVTAEGPRSRIEAIQEFNTGIIDLEGRYEDFSVILNIINTDPFIAVHGSRTIEYQGFIRSIVRETQVENTEDGENL